MSGSGVSSKGIPASLPTEMLIDTTDAGPANLNVTVMVRVCAYGGCVRMCVCVFEGEISVCVSVCVFSIIRMLDWPTST